MKLIISKTKSFWTCCSCLMNKIHYAMGCTSNTCLKFIIYACLMLFVALQMHLWCSSDALEQVPRMKMHYHPVRAKYQAFLFGSHYQFQSWQDWVSLRDKIKVVGGLISNIVKCEKIKRDLVAKCFYDFIHKSYRTRETIFKMPIMFIFVNQSIIT